jgi:hypothetical protein
MYSSGFDDAATESLTTEGAAGERLWELLAPSGDHLTSYGRWAAGRRNDHPRVIRGHVLPPSRPRKSEDVLQQTELLSVGTMGADVPVPMDRESSGHRIEGEQAQIHRHQKEDSNDSAG